jgi:hypothetical protein
MNEIIKKNGINYGIISGVIGVLATAIMYAVDLSLFVNMWVGFGILIVYIIIGCMLLSKTKKELNGVFSFKEAFTTYFISALIGIVLSTLFSFLLFNVIDTDAREKVSELLIKSQVEMLEKFNTPASKINETVAKLEENSQFSGKGLFWGFLQSLVGSIIFGLILAAIFKSKPAYKD